MRIRVSAQIRRSRVCFRVYEDERCRVAAEMLPRRCRDAVYAMMMPPMRLRVVMMSDERRCCRGQYATRDADELMAMTASEAWPDE